MAPSNPFATRFIRPGAIEYLAADGRSLDEILDALRQSEWWGEIIGPHGSGKSTLLASLVSVCQRAGKRIVWRTIRGPGSGPPGPQAEQREEVAATFAAATQGAEQWNGDTLLVLDGYEQLGWWTRRRLQSLCRKRGAGLLVTAHRPLGLPTIVWLEPTEELAQRVVSKLLPAGDETIDRDDVLRAFAASGRNLRETLFALYDVYRLRQGDQCLEDQGPAGQERKPPGEV
ncbi:MAG: hypothetical protein WD872_14110 [Pirellulaceae bacterium]